MAVPVVARLARKLDKPVATLIVSKDPGTKRFIGEALLAAAALYLLNRYCDKYLEGLGFDEMAKAHGKKTKELIDGLRGGGTPPDQLAKAAEPNVEEAIKTIKQNPPSASARSAAELAVQEFVVESGGVTPQGREVAALVTQIVFAAD